MDEHYNMCVCPWFCPHVDVLWSAMSASMEHHVSYELNLVNSQKEKTQIFFCQTTVLVTACPKFFYPLIFLIFWLRDNMNKTRPGLVNGERRLIK